MKKKKQVNEYEKQALIRKLQTVRKNKTSNIDGNSGECYLINKVRCVRLEANCPDAGFKHVIFSQNREGKKNEPYRQRTWI